MSQISRNEWDEIANSFPLCELPLSVSEIEKKLNLSFFSYIEEGLGECFGAYLQTKSSKIYMKGFGHKDNLEPGVLVYVRSFEPSPEDVLYEILNQFSLRRSILPWLCEDLSPPRWQLVRLDDNNNEFEVNRFITKESALGMKEIYDRKKHKQSYFVKELKV